MQIEKIERDKTDITFHMEHEGRRWGVIFWYRSFGISDAYFDGKRWAICYRGDWPDSALLNESKRMATAHFESEDPTVAKLKREVIMRTRTNEIRREKRYLRSLLKDYAALPAKIEKAKKQIAEKQANYNSPL